MNILFVHQSSSLYGSDKVLLNICAGLDKTIFRPIVVLPEQGPLVKELEEIGVEVHIANVCRVSRADLGGRGILKFPRGILRAVKDLDGIAANRQIDLVHSNTIAVFGGAIWAKRRGIPHIWHVHELITTPRLAQNLYPKVIGLLASRIVCNSTATRSWLLTKDKHLASRSLVIWNGTDTTKTSLVNSRNRMRQRYGIHEQNIAIALVGRINRWKGHRLLLEAASILCARGYRDIQYVFVGDAPKGQEHYRYELEDLLDKNGMVKYTKMLLNVDKIMCLWTAIDIAVVPSTEPEPFGMVAIEAMAAGKPVVAAAHGGLLDIVVDGKTGVFFDPGNALSLANKLQYLIDDNDMRRMLGQAGQIRQLAAFTTSRQVNLFQDLYRATA